MTRGKFWFGTGAISAIGLWLRAGFPVYAPGASSYDDMLFIKLAGYLGSGHWLGPYNELIPTARSPRRRGGRFLSNAPLT